MLSFLFSRETAKRNSTHRPQYKSIIQHWYLPDASPIYGMPTHLLFPASFPSHAAGSKSSQQDVPQPFIIMDRALARQVLQEFCGACSVRGVPRRTPYLPKLLESGSLATRALINCHHLPLPLFSE